MTSYSLHENSNGEIVFWTDSSELKNKVVTYLKSKGYKVKDILNRWEKYYGENDF